MADNTMMRRFIGSILLLALFLFPVWYAHSVVTGETDLFSVGGYSLEEVPGWDEADMGDGRWQATRTDGTIDTTKDISLSYGCDGPAVGTATSTDGVTGTVGNLTTNLTVFGDEYLFAIVPTVACSDDGLITAPFTTGADSLNVYFNISWDALLETEVLKLAVNLNNFTFEGYSVGVAWASASGTVVTYETITLVPLKVEEYDAGDEILIPLTTEDRLIMRAWGEKPDNYDAIVFIGLRGDPLDLQEQQGEIVVYDLAAYSTREGILSNEGKMIAFNLIYSVGAVIAALIATPWLEAKDFVPGKRMGRKGAADGRISWIVVIAALGVGVAALFLWGGAGTLTEALTVSFLPFALAVAGVAIVALSMDGTKNRGLTIATAAVVGVLGWTLGLSIQNTWLAFDQVYVRPFSAVLTGSASYTDPWTLSAFFVVAAMVFGLLVCAYNLITTLLTSKRVSMWQ